MEKDFASWFQNQQMDPNWSGGHHRLNGPCSGNMVSPNVTNENIPKEPHAWFYGCHQGFNPTTKEQLPGPGPGPTHEVQKKFLVFDRSNDRTTLIYSSAPVPFHLPKPQLNLDLKRELLVFKKHEDIHCSNPFCEDGNEVGSEMQEDTEELRALLYSDDDDELDYSEEEEEQSTGHSPSNNAEEIASSGGPRKRHRLDKGGYDVVSLEDTASSGRSGVNCSGKPDLDSAGNGLPDVESETMPASKRSRTEKVRETISILENLIPGGKNGKDAMMILDEAINYLRILKVKAQALGLDSL